MRGCAAEEQRESRHAIGKTPDDGRSRKRVDLLPVDGEAPSRRQIVYVIDDDSAVLGSMRFLLSIQGFEPKTFSTAEEFLETVAPGEMGVVVTDVRLPGLTGVELLDGMKKRGLDFPAIVITAYADVPLAVCAMKQGAVDLLEKPFDPGALIDTLRQAFASLSERGESVASEQAVRESLLSLSTREKDVLQELVKGRTNRAIAAELGISQRTVEVHRANIMKKTGAGSLSALVRMTLILEGKPT
jgi:two-component system, LuxR family, response regulator FixJ